MKRKELEGLKKKVSNFLLQLSLSLDVQQFHLKDESCSSRNLWWRSTVTITQVRGYDKSTLLSLTHANQSLIPAFDHLARSQCKREWLTTRNAAVKLCPVLQGTCVMHAQSVSLLRLHLALVRLNALLHTDPQLLRLRVGTLGAKKDAAQKQAQRNLRDHHGGAL